jgi:hypothetical protein
MGFSLITGGDGPPRCPDGKSSFGISFCAIAHRANDLAMYRSARSPASHASTSAWRQSASGRPFSARHRRNAAALRISTFARLRAPLSSGARRLFRR